MMRPRVVLIQADAHERRTTQLMLQGSGIDVRAFSYDITHGGFNGLGPCDCLVIDDGAVPETGSEILLFLRQEGWAQPAILLTASVADEREVFAAILRKPFRYQALASLVRAMSRKALPG